MQFSRDGDWYQVVRVTGPSHNFLALQLGEFGAREPIVERLAVGEAAPVLDAKDVQRQVAEGVTEANADLGTNFHVAAIRFVATDTPSPSIYRSLAKVIVEQLKQEGALGATSPRGRSARARRTATLSP